MLLIPAIDLLDGKCVRLVHGKLEQMTQYSEDPPGMARRWASEGASRLHIVDLDGAFGGGSRQLDVIKAICAAVNIPVELGGGIRDIHTIRRVLEAGVEYAIIGTAAVSSESFLDEACRLFPGRIILGLDTKDGFVSVKGWTEKSSIAASELAKQAKSLGVTAIIHTDIGRDGTLTGPNLEATRSLAIESGMPIIVSGGMSSMEDIDAVMHLGRDGVIGAILGKALYEGRISLSEAIGRVDATKVRGEVS